MPVAWSNGQWIWLDLKGNRYKGGQVRRATMQAMQARQAAAVAKLQAVLGEGPLLPPMHVIAHFLRCASTARRVRGLPIRDQLAALKADTTSRVRGNGDVATFSWFYQHLRNLRFRRPSCLEDSVCCSLFLRRYVAGTSFRIGVVRPPFIAHAWVQVGDVIINDIKCAVEAYSEILRLDV